MLPLQKFNYEELQKIYSEYFSLSYLNTDIGSKFAVISLICFLTHKMRLKKPEVTCYQVITKILDKELHTYNEQFLIGLSIICEDFMRNTTEYLTFDLKTQKAMVSKILEILSSWLPF